MTIDVVILAAGQGTRMRSSLPKVLHRLANKPLVQHVIDNTSELEDVRTHLVIGHGAELVKESVQTEGVTWSIQAEQLGTGHAVMQAMDKLAEEGITLILYGDVPLTSPETFQKMIESVSGDQLGLLTVHIEDPTGYGRIIRDYEGRVHAIVEHKDASNEEKEITEVNTGIMAIPTDKLKEWLPKLDNKNAQSEYYLTDIIEIAVKDGYTVKAIHPACVEETQGVNNRVQLAELERWYQSEQALELMLSGATIADPMRIDVRGEVIVGNDVFIDVNAVFVGRVVLGNKVTIGPNCVIKDSVISDGADIQANSVIEGSEVGLDCNIGPFARIRPGSKLEKGAKVGNFVETKKAVIGVGSKINHLSYIGDAMIGDGVNVGAGTITCNYDGVNKYQTKIEDNVFVGSNTSIVAPAEIKKGATIAAGSVVTNDVDENELAVARSRQRNVKGWNRPTKKTH